MTNCLNQSGSRRSSGLWLLLPLLQLSAAGCFGDQIKVYRVAKEQNQPSQMTAPALPTDSPNQTLPPGHPDISGVAVSSAGAPVQSPLTWTTPSGWTEMPAGEMRVASFKIAGADGKQADVSVIPLGGMAGTELGNVNRWRGQVGLPEITEGELQKSGQTVEANGQPAQLYDVAGTNPASGDATRIVGVIQHRPDATWFYKMTGDADLVAQQKPAFIEFLKSLKMQPAQSQTVLPSGHPAVGDMGAAPAASAPVSHEGQPKWEVPQGWQEVSGGQFLVAKFLVGNGAAAVNVSSSAGDGGGFLDNVNRWRGQLGLPRADASAYPYQKEPDLAGTPYGIIDLTGKDARTGNPARILGAVISQKDQTWFYKLMGDAKVVESQKDAFVKFVQSAKY
jgi:hypothetical protein